MRSRSKSQSIADLEAVGLCLCTNTEDDIFIWRATFRRGLGINKELEMLVLDNHFQTRSAVVFAVAELWPTSITRSSIRRFPNLLTF